MPEAVSRVQQVQLLTQGSCLVHRKVTLSVLGFWPRGIAVISVFGGDRSGTSISTAGNAMNWTRGGHGLGGGDGGDDEQVLFHSPAQWTLGI